MQVSEHLLLGGDPSHLRKTTLQILERAKKLIFFRKVVTYMGFVYIKPKWIQKKRVQYQGVAIRPKKVKVESYKTAHRTQSW